MALVVVQRGHCFRTSGATGAPGEQAFTKAAADRVAFHVRALGHQVWVINADVAPALYSGDLFVALHYDSSSNSSARGASVGYKTEAGHRFAEAWKRHYVANGWTGGFRDDNYTPALAGYYGVRRAVEAGTTRAFIAEAGFHSNPQDAALLAAPEGPDRVGRAVAAAVAELVGGKAPTPIEEDPDMAFTDAHAAKLEELHKALTTGRFATQVWTHEVGKLPTNSGAAADYLRKIRIAAEGDDIDEAEVARLVLLGLPAEQIAGVIPEELAQDVAEELAARLAD